MPETITSGAEGYPLVSVVTPSHQAMPYIVETVKSVQSQDYPAIEHIVIDGGSTDGTLEFLQTQPQLVWVSEPDRGQSHALNKGFGRARGDIIGWLNADDTYQPGAVSIATRFMQDHPEVDLVYGDVRIVDERGQQVGLSRSQYFEFEKLLFSNFIKQPTVFMRRRVLEQLNGVDENLHYVMDRDLWLRAGAVGFKLHYLRNHVLANFRLIQGTKTYEHNPHFRMEWLQVLERTFKQTEFLNLLPSLKAKVLRKNQAQYHVSCMIQAIDQHDRRDMLNNLIKSITTDPHLLFNRGIWFFTVRGVLGLGIDRLRRFRKKSIQESL